MTATHYFFLFRFEYMKELKETLVMPKSVLVTYDDDDRGLRGIFITLPSILIPVNVFFTVK